MYILYINYKNKNNDIIYKKIFQEKLKKPKKK